MVNDRQTFLSSQKLAEMEAVLREADFADHLMSSWMLKLMKTVELHAIESLVFGSPGEIWWKQSTSATMLYGTFHPGEVTGVIQPTVQLFLLIFAAGLCGAILYSTLKVGANPHNPNTKYEFAESVKSWFVSGLFLASYPTILDLLFGLNETIRVTFYDWMGRRSGLSFVSTHNFSSNRAFGDITLAFAEFVTVVYLNFIYLARKFILMLLIVMGPVMGVFLFFQNARVVVWHWMRQMIGNIFIQSVHAILLFLMASSTGFSNAGAFAKIAWLVLLIPVAGMVSRWFAWGGWSRTEQRFHLLGLGYVGGLMTLTRESVNVWKRSTNRLTAIESVQPHEELQSAGQVSMPQAIRPVARETSKAPSSIL